MKVVVLLACAVLTTKTVTCASISQSPFDFVELEDLTEEDKKQLKILEEMYHEREKRSHSYHHHQEDPLTELKESLKKGLKAKLALVAKGSASASAHLSKSSSKGSSGGDYYHHHHHHDEGHHDHKSFDFWSLKKSILNTLLQAVKAIKGGVIAIKGQLIKGSGYLISAKGKLISAKGEAITKLGKNIATSAILSGHHHHGHADYGHYHHSGSEVYGASAPGPEYEVPEHIHHPPPPHEDKPDTDHGGILILKKIPSHTARGHSDHVADRKVPDFKPIKPSGPSFKEILGKFFKASTSLTPGEPAPFDDHSSPGHDDYHHDHEEYHADPHSHEFEHPPSGHESHHDSSHEFLPSSSHSDSESYKLSSYGFEEAPAYLDIKEHKSESIQSETYQKPSTEKPVVEILKPSYSSSFSSSSSSLHHGLGDTSRPSSSSFLSSSSSNHGLRETSKPSYSSSFSSSSKPGLGLAAFATNPHKTSLFTSAKDPLQSLPAYHAKLLPTIKPEDNFGAFKNTGVETSVKYLSPEVIGQQVFPAVSFDSLKSSHRSPYHSYHDSLSSSSSSSHKIALKRPPRSHKTRSKNTRNKNSHKPKRSPNYQVVRSAPYKLGPKGPKRI